MEGYSDSASPLSLPPPVMSPLETPKLVTAADAANHHQLAAFASLPNNPHMMMPPPSMLNAASTNMQASVSFPAFFTPQGQPQQLPIGFNAGSFAFNASSTAPSIGGPIYTTVDLNGHLNGMPINLVAPQQGPPMPQPGHQAFFLDANNNLASLPNGFAQHLLQQQQQQQAQQAQQQQQFHQHLLAHSASASSNGLMPAGLLQQPSFPGVAPGQQLRQFVKPTPFLAPAPTPLLPPQHLAIGQNGLAINVLPNGFHAALGGVGPQPQPTAFAQPQPPQTFGLIQTVPQPASQPTQQLSDITLQQYQQQQRQLQVQQQQLEQLKLQQQQQHLQLQQQISQMSAQSRPSAANTPTRASIVSTPPPLEVVPTTMAKVIPEPVSLPIKKRKHDESDASMQSTPASVASVSSPPPPSEKRRSITASIARPAKAIDHPLLSLLDATAFSPAEPLCHESKRMTIASPTASAYSSSSSTSSKRRRHSDSHKHGESHSHSHSSCSDEEEVALPAVAVGRPRATTTVVKISKTPSVASMDASSTVDASSDMSALISASLEPEVDAATGGVVYICRFDHCGDTFKTRFSLKRHLKKHSGEKPFVCTYAGCAKRFAEKSTLKRHVRIHTGEKPYRCSVQGCGKFFADRTNVKRHEMIHSGMRPYWCPHESCSRGYFWRKHLKKHMQTVHKRDLVATDADGVESDEFDEEEEEGEEPPNSDAEVEEMEDEEQEEAETRVEPASKAVAVA